MSQESNVDGLGFGNLSVGSGESSAPAPVRPAHRYKMDHARRGLFIIINNKTFDPSTGMSERTGTDVDAGNLRKLFRTLGFDVHLENNLRAEQMLRLMTEAGRRDHSDCDCFGVAVLSHGEQGILFGTDRTIEVDHLIAPIKSCRSLAGKPKLYFFQACRGTELDEGQEVEQDDATPDPPRNLARIPIEADFLYAYSTTPGYFSWRNSSKGSWFVQALYKVLSELVYTDMDLLRILTRVCHSVAYDFESNASQAHMNRKKQVPSIVSMLTKDVYFTRK